MKKVIIFSNFGKLYAVDEDFASRTDIKILTKSSILFSENGNEFSSVENFSENGLYFVFDEMPEKTFNNLVGTSEKANFYILLHSEPKYVTGFKNLAKGMNASREIGGEIYPDVVDILKDEKGDKVKRIFEKVFTFDQKEEDFTEAIFKSIYTNESETAIEKEVATRDNYLKEKVKQAK